jgi:ABC-type uncharacterized transport system involved in gliding motility auxiliary subunit
MRSWLFPLWVIIDVLLFISVLSLWITAPEYLSLNWGLTTFAVSLALILAFIKQREIKAFVNTSYFRHAIINGFQVVLILAIFGLLNYLGNKNFREFDITREKRNSLSEQTTKVVNLIKAPLTMTVFSRREEWQGILNLLKLYKAQDEKIKIEAIDTDLRPDLVKAKGITQNGTVLLSYQGKESMFQVSDELSVTNALLKVLRENDIVLYFVTGHKELSCNDNSEEGISILCEGLKAQNYQIKDLDLTRSSEIPKDASGVFILGPATGFLKSEVEQLKSYLDRGGSLYLALAPAFKSDMYRNLVQLARPFGLEMGQDIVIDRLSTVQGAEATIPIVTQYDQEHPITAGFNLRTIFPLSASIRTIGDNDSAQLLALTSSFPGSWAETDLKGVTNGKTQFDDKSDLKGPIGLMGIGENTNSTLPSRFVLLGSSSFLINAYQGQSGNGTLFQNAVSWMINDEGIISFNRPGQTEDLVVLSSQHLQMIFIISIFLVPILFFGTAIFVYRRRRLL